MHMGCVVANVLGSSEVAAPDWKVFVLVSLLASRARHLPSHITCQPHAISFLALHAWLSGKGCWVQAAREARQDMLSTGVQATLCLSALHNLNPKPLTLCLSALHNSSDTQPMCRTRQVRPKACEQGWQAQWGNASASRPAALCTRATRWSVGEDRARPWAAWEQADRETWRWNEGVELNISGDSRMESMARGEVPARTSTAPGAALPGLAPLMLLLLVTSPAIPVCGPAIR